jgi:LacI family transcriptional regulator
VSVGTVSNYLNGTGRMSPATRTAVQSAIKSLDFAPSALMQGLQHRRTGRLGVVTFPSNDPARQSGASLVTQALSECAAREDHDLLVYFCRPDHDDRPSRALLDGYFDGLIWMAPTPHPTLERLAAAGVPVVAWMSRNVPDAVGYIAIDGPASALAVPNIAEAAIACLLRLIAGGSVDECRQGLDGSAGHHCDTSRLARIRPPSP